MLGVYNAPSEDAVLPQTMTAANGMRAMRATNLLIAGHARPRVDRPRTRLEERAASEGQAATMLEQPTYVRRSHCAAEFAPTARLRRAPRSEPTE